MSEDTLHARKKTTLEIVDAAVKTSIPQRRARRFWLVWALWAVFGSMLTLRGLPAAEEGGGANNSSLALAWILMAPFWFLFVLWPILWLRDRIANRALWAEDVVLILAESPDKRNEDDIAIPVVIGRGESGVLVPIVGWETAFPTLTSQVLVLKPIAAGDIPGVEIACYDARDLLTSIEMLSATSRTVAESDRQAARRWAESLDRAMRF